MVAFTGTTKDGTWVALAATGWKPELRPPAMGWQGAPNDVWVTVWFLGMKTNSTVSPGFAVTWLGLYSSADPPTMTWKLVAEAVVARVARAAEARVKRILTCL